MDIDKNYKKLIAEEFRQIVKLIDNESENERKAFFFSGTGAVTQRISYIDFDPELICITVALNSTYNIISDLIEANRTLEERIIEIPDDFFGKLTDLIKDLAKAIEEDKNVYELLQKIIVLGYSITPDGYYRYKLGAFKI